MMKFFPVLTLFVLLPACSHSTPPQITPATTAIKGIEQDMIREHNAVRAGVGVPPLQWSKTLMHYAQNWANTLARTNNCTMQHRSSDSPYGENLYWASAVLWSNGIREIQSITPKDVVTLWAAEVEFYSYPANTCRIGKSCGHYTQIVWKNSRRVGCAKATCNDKSQVWVCNYDPPGNYRGQSPY